VSNAVWALTSGGFRIVSDTLVKISDSGRSANSNRYSYFVTNGVVNIRGILYPVMLCQITS